MMPPGGVPQNKGEQSKGTAMAQGLIGVFDSGVGGLTVARSIMRVLPHHSILYVADQAHVPYGGRPLEEVRGFALGISRFLADQGCGAVVMACNISSAVALERARRLVAPRPVLGVIDAAVARVVRDGATRIGVLATEGTVRSDAYRARIMALRPQAQVVQVPCPKFVPLVERGAFDGEEAEEAARAYLQPLADARCTAVILGCTHYPFLLGVLNRVANQLFEQQPAFIDPAEELSGDLKKVVPHRASALNVTYTMLTTGDVATFRQQLHRFLPTVDVEVGFALWRGQDLNRAVPEKAAQGARITE